MGRNLIKKLKNCFYRDRIFTHHQKVVIVDSASSTSSEKRRLVSFIGGLDLCGGRYDTEKHSLFRTLEFEHSKDFNNPYAKYKNGGPQEPWHDIHCRLEGPAAWDVLTNFEQRWRKQGLGKDLLVQRSILEGDLFHRPDDEAANGNDAWNVQVFRSLTDAAADFEGTTSKVARLKNYLVEKSIQDAYIHAIRRAKRFIYIESQYFIGSGIEWNERSGSWLNPEDEESNLIPKELSLKIISKIKDGEPFAVYVVLPMWPEGKADSRSVKDILLWQRRTMEMMYTDVTKELKAKK